MWDPISFRRRPRAPGTSLGERNGPTIQAFKTKALQFASLPPLSTPACGCGERRKACRPKSHRFIGLYGWPISFPKGGCQELWAPFERKDPLACALKPPPGTELGRCLRDEAVVAWCPSGRPQRRGFTGNFIRRALGRKPTRVDRFLARIYRSDTPGIHPKRPTR